jgi:hypothetical protein
VTAAKPRRKNNNNSPGDVLVLTKTTEDLEAMGNKVDWSKSESMVLGDVGPSQASNNTTKSVA